MRNRLLIFAMMASCLAIAQSTGTPAQDPNAQQGQPGQQPQNPLNQAPTGIQQEQQQQQQQQTQAKPVTFDTTGVNNTGEDQMLGELRVIQRYSEANGDLSKTFRIDPHTLDVQCETHPGVGVTVFTPGCVAGAFYQQYEFNFFIDHAFRMWHNHRIQMLDQYRGTSDVSVDPERNSLQKAYVRIFSPHDEIIVGDALVNYSRLTFNQNIKGLSVSTKIGPKWKLSLVSGVFTDRYGSLYKTFTALPGRPYMSLVNGGRLERAIGRNSTLGLNFSSSVDQVGSIPLVNPITGVTNLVGTAPTPASNQVASVDGRFAFKNGIRIDTEFAYSFTDFDRRFSATCLNPATVVPCDTRFPQDTLNGKQGDWAGRFEASWRKKKLTLRTAFLRYQPNFTSINARQISDLQDWLVRASYDLTDWLTLDGTVRRSNNDLKDQLSNPGLGIQATGELTTWGPEMHFVFHDLPFYKKATYEFGFRYRSSFDPTSNINRFMRNPYAEFTLPIRPMFLTLGYERRQLQDNVDQSQASNTDRVYAGLRGIFDIGKWQINPSFRYELEREAHRPGYCQPSTVPPCLNVGDPRMVHDTNRLASVSMYIESPKYFIFEGQFRSSSASILSLTQNGILPPPFLVAPAGFSRPSYQGTFTYKIRNDENFRFFFTFERYSNFFFTTADYDERIWQGGIIYRFGRKGQ